MLGECTDRQPDNERTDTNNAPPNISLAHNSPPSDGLPNDCLTNSDHTCTNSDHTRTNIK